MKPSKPRKPFQVVRRIVNRTPSWKINFVIATWLGISVGFNLVQAYQIMNLREWVDNYEPFVREMQMDEQRREMEAMSMRDHISLCVDRLQSCKLMLENQSCKGGVDDPDQI